VSEARALSADRQPVDDLPLDERREYPLRLRSGGSACRMLCWSSFGRGGAAEEIGSEIMKLRTPGRSGNVEMFGTMKSITVLSLIIATFICLLSGCSRAQQLPATDQPPPAEKKILVVYLSRTNNAKAIAEFIRQKVGGTMVALELERPYPADYNATVRQVARENETGYSPPLKTKIDRIEQYDIVFLCFPTWGMRLPPPIKSFLRQYSLKGKTVIPFNTNGGYGEGSSFQTIRGLCPQSTVLEGFVTGGGLERDGQYLVIKEARAEEAQREVESWLRKIKMLP
jgi:flavodoxin